MSINTHWNHKSPLPPLGIMDYQCNLQSTLFYLVVLFTPTCSFHGVEYEIIYHVQLGHPKHIASQYILQYQETI